MKVWLFEDDEIYPVYTRKRKELSSNKKELVPAQWKTVTVSDNVMYLGDNTTNLKLLDWRAGKLMVYFYCIITLYIMISLFKKYKKIIVYCT